MTEKAVYIAFFGSAALSLSLIGIALYKLLPFWIFVVAMAILTLGSLIGISCVFVSGYNSRIEESMYRLGTKDLKYSSRDEELIY